MIKYEIELTRHNVTPAAFLSYVRSQLRKKGLAEITEGIELDYFRRGDDLNFYYHSDPQKPARLEKSVSRPYEYQTCIQNWDGTQYNEICEFTFDDEKTGTGYYYMINTIFAELPNKQSPCTSAN